MKITEPLYLEKNQHSIVVAEGFTSLLYQHQVEGLRFLYRHFKKKKPGLILNDATGYGKKTQIILFLNAIKHVLAQSLLVLCSETEMPKWKKCFATWSEHCNDIAFDSCKAFPDKKIFVNSLDDVPVLSKREWSIVVVDDPVSLKQFKTLKSVKASFKIWIVSIDMKVHLNTFAAIYEWIYPCEKFSVEQFQPDVDDYADVIAKNILLDCFFEHLVLRRGKSHLDDRKHINPAVGSIKRESKKNKDPTGAKVKRTKRKITSDDEEQPTPKTSVRKDIAQSTFAEDFRIRIPDSIESVEETLQNEDEVIEGNDHRDELEIINKTAFSTAEDLSDDSAYDLNTIPIDAFEVNETTDQIKEIGKGSPFHNPIVEDKSDHDANKYNVNVLKKPLMKYEIGDRAINSKDIKQKNELITNVSNESLNKLDDICSLDEKMKDLEEEANKRFKGSLLDSLTQVNKRSPLKYQTKVAEEYEPDEISHKITEVKNETIGTGKNVENICDDRALTGDGSLEGKMKDLEKKTQNKYKGSILDIIF